MSILVVLEQRDGKWNRMSFETIAAGRKIASSSSPFHLAVLGNSITNLAEEVTGFGAEKVFVLEDPLLAEYTPEAYTSALEQLIRAVQPAVVIFPHTYQVRDYAPKLATRFDKVLVSDVIDIKSEGADVAFIRQLFQGKLVAEVLASGDPRFVSIQAGAFRAAEPGNEHRSAIEKFALTLKPDEIRSKPEKPFREAQRSVDLGAAEYIVSVGRGIKDKDNLHLAEELASVLGAELAASRPICDNGWLPMERQVGSSGQTVAPKIYFAIGISGTIQHLVGMKASKTIVAINKDEKAPIFEAADYGIVGDLFEVVPAIVQELKKAKT